MIHLYIDTFISDNPLRATKENLKNIKELNFLRRKNSHYQIRKKKDIFKFSILSYSIQNWKSVKINFECEDKSSYSELNSYIKKKFKNASISNLRSTSAENFLKNILDYPDEDWIFFVINNDHPIISNKKLNFKNLVVQANEYKNTLVSIQYSHLPELYLSIKFGDILYKYNLNSFKKIKETKSAIHLKSELHVTDTLAIYKAKDLKKLFSKELNDNKRVVRLEDLSSYRKLKKHIIIVPKFNIAYHYDGYLHTRNVSKYFLSLNKFPPLFIPKLFFSKSYEVIFGIPNKDSDRKSVIYSCANAKKYSFERTLGVELKFCPNNFPRVYLDNAKKITTICKNCPNSEYFDYSLYPRNFYFIGIFRLFKNFLYKIYKLIK